LHLLVVLAPPEDNTANFVTAVPVRSRHNFLAVLAAVEPLDFPDIRLNSCILELLDRPDHQSRPNLQVIGLLVSLDAVELRFLCWHKQLEHEQPVALGVQVIG
jgi:hypothetical protein